MVTDTIATHGRAPSYDEIRKALDIGTRAEVCRFVAALEAAGKLRRAGRGRVRRISLA